MHCLRRNLISVAGNRRHPELMQTQISQMMVHHHSIPEATDIGRHNNSRRRSRSLRLSNRYFATIDGSTNMDASESEYSARTHDARGYRRYIIKSLWFTLLCTIYNTPLLVDGSHPNLAFTPLSPILSPSHLVSLQRSTTIQLSSTSRRHANMAPTRDSSHQLHRHRKRIMPKIKSPSNSYSQFYKDGILVSIERTSPNSRRISGEVIMDTSIDAIWSILTDYDNLNVHVPNLVESKVISSGDSSSGLVDGRTGGGRGPRVHQKGAQRIFGFEFSADVTLEMKEYIHHPGGNNEMKTYSIDFQCVQSQCFSQFDGSWILEEYSNSRTMVRYIVDVMPKGPVPVAALEWRIKEDVPVNILAVSKSARAVNVERKDNLQAQKAEESIGTRQQQQQQQQQQHKESPPKQ
ncbi:hypothetical protein ACHAXH_007069, partial [Discostella pseudostelligera]